MKGKDKDKKGIIEATEEINPSLIYNQDKAAIETQAKIAQERPRDIAKSTKNAIAIATIDKKTAESCIYAILKEGKAIVGVSVHLARILAQNWGNMRIDAKVTGIDNKYITSEAVCFDLEINLAMKAEVKRSVMSTMGRMNDDLITLTGNALNAIALRNSILSVIPKQVTDAVFDKVKDKILGDVSTKPKLKKRVRQVVDNLVDCYKFKEKNIYSAIGRENVDKVTPDDLIVLIGITQGIKDGDNSLETVFKTASQVPAKIESPQNLHGSVKAKKAAMKAKGNSKTPVFP